MRSRSMLRAARPVHLGAGAALLAIPACAVAVTAGSADAQSTIALTLTPHRAPYGHAVTVSGGELSASGNERLELQFAPAGSGRWRALGTTTASRTGAFEFRTRAQRSGLLRVLPVGSPGRAGTSAVIAAAGEGASPVQSLTVGARFLIHPRSQSLTGGRRAQISGHLLPALAGRRVVLAIRSRGGWRSVDATRTRAGGRFTLHAAAPAGGRRFLQVRFAGDRASSAATAAAGSVSAPAPIADQASWYDDGGATACGFHAALGVANRTLPCGTRVSISYGGHTVVATVDDRGPYVGGRNWDLNQNTAGALGFSGVGTVWVAY